MRACLIEAVDFEAGVVVANDGQLKDALCKGKKKNPNTQKNSRYERLGGRNEESRKRDLGHTDAGMLDAGYDDVAGRM